MKTKFTNCVRSFSGRLKSQGLVHCKYNQGNLIITRKYPVVEIIEHHHTFGTTSKNLGKLFRSFSSEYVADLKNYTVLLSKRTNLNEKLSATHYAVYLAMMWKLKSQFPEIDLVTLTKDDILKHEYPVLSIVESMQSGMLQDIPEGRVLEHKI
jgi:hypothetical protein